MLRHVLDHRIGHESFNGQASESDHGIGHELYCDRQQSLTVRTASCSDEFI